MPAQRPRKRTTKSRKSSGGGGFALPGFRFLIPAAVIAGGWMLAQDMGLSMDMFDRAEKQKRPQAALSTPKTTSSSPERSEAKARETRPRQVARDTAIVPPVRPTVSVAARQETKPLAAETRTPATAATPDARPSLDIARAEARPPVTPVTPATQRSAPAGKLLFASVEANLRMQANGESNVIAILPRGAAVKLLASRNEWRLVSTSRRLGWVHRDQLEEATGAIQRPAAQLGGERVAQKRN